MIKAIKHMREIILTDLVPSNPRLARASLLEMYVLILTFLQETSKLNETDSINLKPLRPWIGGDKDLLELLQSLEKDIDFLSLNKKLNNQ